MTGNEESASAKDDAGSQESESTKAEIKTPAPSAEVIDLIQKFNESADTNDAIAPGLGKWQREKARYLEKGLLRILLDFEREAQRDKVFKQPWQRYKYAFAWHIESTRALVQLSQGALRAAALVNAGAAVAILAFLGQTWDTGIKRSQFAACLAWFAGGVLVASIAAGTAYWAQLNYGQDNDKSNRAGLWIHRATAALFVAALLVFAIGSWQTYRAFIDGPSKEEITMTEKPRPQPTPPRPSQPPPRTDEPGKVAPPPPKPPVVPTKPSR